MRVNSTVVWLTCRHFAAQFSLVELFLRLGISGLLFRSIMRLAKGIVLLIPLKLADRATILYADEYAYPDGVRSNPKNQD